MVLCGVGTRIFKFWWCMSWEIANTKFHFVSVFLTHPFKVSKVCLTVLKCGPKNPNLPNYCWPCLLHDKPWFIEKVEHGIVLDLIHFNLNLVCQKRMNVMIQQFPIPTHKSILTVNSGIGILLGFPRKLFCFCFIGSLEINYQLYYPITWYWYDHAGC